MCLAGSAIRITELCLRGVCMAGSGSRRLMKKDVKVGYGLLALFFAVCLAILMFFVADWLSFAASWVGCDESSSESSCLGLSSAFRYVIRISFLSKIVIFTFFKISSFF